MMSILPQKFRIDDLVRIIGGSGGQLKILGAHMDKHAPEGLSYTVYSPFVGAATGVLESSLEYWTDVNDIKDASITADESLPVVLEIGVWSVELMAEEGRIYLTNGDLSHDVHLHIVGDFSNDEEKLAYANSIAAKLNKSERA